MPPLVIYKASAGSGKTYALTQEYLKLLLSKPGIHRHILAVTFTNKAAGEMKQRILRSLHTLSKGSGEDPGVDIKALQEATGLDPEKIRERAGRLLKVILNDYSGFSVGTIDKFFQRVIRAFTHEIGIEPGYNLELDHDRILSLAVDMLFQDLTLQQDLCDWLIRFTEEQIESGRSWNFRQQIIGLGNQLFREAFQELFPDRDVGGTGKHEIGRYLDNLEQIKKERESELRESGKRAMAELQRQGFTLEDFRLKQHSAASLFHLAEEGGIPGFTESRLEALFDKDKWLNKGAGRELEVLTEKYLIPELRHLYDQTVVLNSVNEIKKNIYTLGILDDLRKRVQDYSKERNLFLMADSSRFLKGIIGSNQVPFIYEKTGERYNHIMLDEFQDTSRFQYDNFRPLIDHSLASGNRDLVVGDLKQSIYRWRNSDWRILASGITEDFIHQEIHTEHLDQNHRSREMIIRFNNTLFQIAPEILEERIVNELGGSSIDPGVAREEAGQIRNAYGDAVQNIPPESMGSEGRVELELFPESEEQSFQEQVLSRLPGWIDELLENGIRPGEVALLVRYRKEAIALSGLLLEHARKKKRPWGYRLISNESLVLGGNPSVNLLICLLKYIVNPDDGVNGAWLKYLCYRNGLTGGLPLERIFDSDCPPGTVLPGEFTDSLHRLGQLPLFELNESLISIFGLDKKMEDVPYLQAYQDILMDLVRRESASIGEFLEFWEEEGKQKGIHGSEESDAIKILTIHKAKGLEFRAVIVPFCDWGITTESRRMNILWCPTKNSPFQGIPFVPLHLSRKLGQTVFITEYVRERVRGYMDNLNLLYVALTRARDILYVGVPERSENRMKTTGDLICRILPVKPEREPALDALARYRSGNVIRLGSIPEKQDRDEKENTLLADVYPVSRSTIHLRVRARNESYFVDEEGAYRTERMYGNLMHGVFSKIRTSEDIKPVLRSLRKEGILTSTEEARLYSRIHELIAPPEVSGWFSKDAEHLLFNERTILCGDGSTIRPDRVMIEGKRACVVDFKFGTTEDPRYDGQVREYMNWLGQMGYQPVEGFVWYVVLGKVGKIKHA